MNVVVDWNGTDLPEELKALPAGRYLVEPVDVIEPLTEDEEQGLRDAMRSVGDGKGVPVDLARSRLQARVRR